MAATWSLTPEWQYSLLIGMAATLVVLVERRVAGHEMSRDQQHRLEDRDTAARLMALELAYDRSQSVLESLREGVLVVDSAGEVVLANPAASRALLQPHLDPIGRILWDVLPPEMSQHARDGWNALRDEAAKPNRDAAAIRYSSIPCRDLYFDLTAVPVTSAETGQDFGTVFLFVDTTRNHELQQLKDRFLSSVSHELRTPLTNICAYSEILTSMIPGESMEWPEFAKIIHEEGLQLSELVDGMFDFLQLESGEAAFRSEDVDAAAIVRELMTQFAETAKAHGVDLMATADSVDRLLHVDRARFEQVCRHLVDNAIKFTPSGGHVKVVCSESEDGFVLRVDDSGPGVPKDDRSSVFEKFTQLRDHMTDKPSGAGLGLATCRAIVGRFGGLIWCEDSELGGAGFVVRLPLAGQSMLTGAAGVGGF